MQNKHKPSVVLHRMYHRGRIAAQARGRVVADPVFVIAAPRTGSTMLVDLLRSLPGVTFRGEVLNAGNWIGLREPFVSQRALKRHLRHTISALPGPVRGAKLILDQMEARGLGPADLVALFPEARFILLYRRSLADQLVSWKLARNTGQWQNRNGSGANDGRRVIIDSDEAAQHFQRVRGQYERFVADQSTHGRSIDVCYEDLAADPDGTIARQVCPFLNVEPAPVATNLRKQVSRPIADLISNWDEVASALTAPDASLELNCR